MWGRAGNRIRLACTIVSLDVDHYFDTQRGESSDVKRAASREIGHRKIDVMNHSCRLTIFIRHAVAYKLPVGVGA